MGEPVEAAAVIEAGRRRIEIADITMSDVEWGSKEKHET